MIKITDDGFNPHELDKQDIEEYIEKFGKAAVDAMLSNEVDEKLKAEMDAEALKVKEGAVFDLDKALDTYDPTFPRYTPSLDAFEFFTQMRLVEGKDFDFATPIAHYFMVDLMLGYITDPMMFPYSEEVCKTISIDQLAIGFMESRGLAKALPLDYPIMSPMREVYGVNHTIGNCKVGDTIYDGNGKECKITAKSEIFNRPMYRITLLDGREIDMSEDHINIVWKRTEKQIGSDKTKPIVCSDGGKRFKPIKISGLEEVNMTAKELYEKGVTWNRKVNAKNPKGVEYKYWIPNVGLDADYGHNTNFPIDPYTVGIILGDGSIEEASGYSRITCHNNDLDELIKNIPYQIGKITTKKGSDCSMFGILGLGPLTKKFVGIDRSYTKKVPYLLKVASRHERLEVLRGLMDTDGCCEKQGSCHFDSTSIQLAEDVQYLVRSLGGSAKIKENKTPSPFGISYRVIISINEDIFKLSRKRNRQQFRNDKYCVAITKIEKIESRPTQCITVDSPHQSFITKDWTVTHNSTIVISFFGVYSAIKGELPNGIGKVYFYLWLAASSKGGARINALAVRAMCEESVYLRDYFEEMRFTETESEFVRKGSGPRKNRSFLIRYQGINTGVRGSRYGERRPCLIGLDDAILNTAAAYSKVMMANLENIIYSDALSALKGGGKGRIFITFTPFHYNDVNTKAILNGTFTPCVIPIARMFDIDNPKLTARDINSSWEDMHPATSIATMVKKAKAANKLKMFMQERMLRLTSGSDRLIPDHCIQFCDMSSIEKNINGYNIYISTDYTTTSGETSDFSGIATWAVNSNEDWFLLGLTLRKMGMETQYEITLEQASKYKRRGKNVEIGVEVDGNQSAHVLALEKLMRERGTYFSFARQKGSLDSQRKGLLSKNTGVNKHERFRIASQVLLQKKMYFPEHLRDTPDMKEFIEQIKGATHENFTRSDDGPDLITQAVVTMHVYYPMYEAVNVENDESRIHYYGTTGQQEISAYDSY